MFDCPGDGTCSGQGTCDGTTGTCVCFEGFERSSGICKGKLFIIALRSFEYILLTLICLFSYQMFHVLVLDHLAAVMVSVISQLEFALALKDFKDQIALVRLI